MRIFVIDSDRCGLDFALRCAAYGHEVRLLVDKGVKDGQGFKGLTLTHDLKQSIKWVGKDGLIKTTANSKYMDELDRWRSIGYQAFSPTKASSELEINRAKGMEVMKIHGMNIPEYREFNSLKEALEFAWKAKDCYVFKPMGNETDKSLTFVPNDPAMLVGWIEKQIMDGKKLKGKCMLQKKIDMIAEVGIAGFMGRDGFVGDEFEISFEHKKLCSGDYGPSVGESGTVIQYVKNDPLIDSIKLMENHFRALGHTGDLSINGGIDSKGNYWPFEFTARAGWPDEPIRFSVHKNKDPAQWMKDALNGENTLKVSNNCAIGVVVAQKPYPFSNGDSSMVEGKPIYGIKKVADDVHFFEAYLGKGPVWNGDKTIIDVVPLTAGTYIMVVTGQGKTVSDAKNKVYNNINQIHVADAIIRNDIGEKLKDKLPELHDAGIAKEIEYA